MTAEKLPAPLVPAEVDLRDFQYMELDVQTLRDSKFAAEVEPEAFRAGVLLWCASWHQVPAASLPDNDKELSGLAGFGRVVKEWLKFKEEALALFVKCSDGRLYHRVISKKAVTAWESRLHHHYDRARDRLRKLNKSREAAGQPLLPEITFDQWNELRIAGGIPMEKADAAVGIPTETRKPSAGIPLDSSLKGKGNGKGDGTEMERNGDSLGSEAIASGAAAPGEQLPLVVVAVGEPLPSAAEMTRTELWRAGKSLLTHQGMPEKQCGSFVGKLVKSYGEEIVVDAIREAIVKNVVDAQTWLPKACGMRSTRSGAGQSADSLAASMRASLTKASQQDVA
jgi:hypothetical protein